jgi:hypothetical protein
MKIVYFDDTENPYVHEDYGREMEDDIDSDGGPDVMGYEVQINENNDSDEADQWCMKKFGGKPQCEFPWAQTWWAEGENYFFKKKDDAMLFELTFG